MYSSLCHVRKQEGEVWMPQAIDMDGEVAYSTVAPI